MGPGVRRIAKERSVWGVVRAAARAAGWAWWSAHAWNYRRQAATLMRHSDAVAARADVLRAKALSARKRAERLAGGAPGGRSEGAEPRGIPGRSAGTEPNDMRGREGGA